MNSPSDNTDGSKPYRSSEMGNGPNDPFAQTGRYPDSGSADVASGLGPQDPFGEPLSSETSLSAFLINGLCILLILLLVSFIFLVQQRGGEENAKLSPRADLAEFTFQSKVILGFKVLSDKNPLVQDQNQDELQMRFGRVGSVRMRQAGAVMVSELESSEDALVILALLEKKAEQLDYEFSESEAKTNDLLRTVFQDSAAALTPLEKEHLRAELLWFGELALSPASKDVPAEANSKRNAILEGAESTLYAVASLSFLVLLCLVIGLVGGILMLVFYRSDKLLIRTVDRTGESSIYLESFTVWFVTFVLYSLILGIIAPDTNPLVSNAIVFLASLASSLVWSAFRGKLNQKSRMDIGYCGNPIRELPVAIWCYLCGLPLVAVGFITTTVLASRVSSGLPESLESSGPTHPILEWVMIGDATTIGLVFFVACFCAPLVEETVFRGFLYRSLRDGSNRMGHFGSTLLSATINGLLFAAIHPQGILFIPPLCALGMVFSFAREWRGSLWAPIFMHALHNGIVTTTLVFIVLA